MNLLAPLGLLALLLAPIIIAIHLWRIRHRRYSLSSTLLWSRVLAERPSRRPRHLPARWVLLALQLAALGCGAIALAHPTWVDANSHRRMVIALDTSLAMSAVDVRPSRLSQALDAARALIATMRPGDTATLVDAGSAPRLLLTSQDPDELRRALGDVAQTAGASSLAVDGPLLDGLSAALGSTAQTYLFAPFGLDLTTATILQRSVPRLTIRSVGVTGDDRGVAGLTVSCASGTSQCEAFARLVNTGAATLTRVAATVDTADGASQVGTRTVDLPAHSAVPISLALPRGATGVQLRIDGHDALSGDDTAWAVVPKAARYNILLISGDSGTTIVQALQAIPNVHVRVMTPDAYLAIAAHNEDLTVLDSTDASIQPPGNQLLINPPDGNVFFSPAGNDTSPGITELRANDPLLRDVDLSSLIISSAMRTGLPAWAHADIQGDSGPLLFSGITGGRRVAVLLFDPRPLATSNPSNLSSLLAFPTLLRNIVEALAPQPAQAAPAGQVMLTTERQQSAVVIRADGSALPLAGSGAVAALPALAPGRYTLANGSQTVPLAVNAAVPNDPAAVLAQPAPAPTGTTVQAPAAIARLDLWAVIALLALLVLGGEWWFFARRT